MKSYQSGITPYELELFKKMPRLSKEIQSILKNKRSLLFRALITSNIELPIFVNEKNVEKSLKKEIIRSLQKGNKKKGVTIQDLKNMIK